MQRPCHWCRTAVCLFLYVFVSNVGFVLRGRVYCLFGCRGLVGLYGAWLVRALHWHWRRAKHQINQSRSHLQDRKRKSSREQSQKPTRTLNPASEVAGYTTHKPERRTPKIFCYDGLRRNPENRSSESILPHTIPTTADCPILDDFQTP